MDFMKRELLEVPEIDSNLNIKINKLEQDILNINSINKKIVTNNSYKKSLNEISSDYYLKNPPAPPSISSNELKDKMNVLSHDAHRVEAKIRKLKAAQGTCPECLQEVDEATVESMRSEEEKILFNLRKEVGKLKKLYDEALEREKEIRKHKHQNSEFIRLNQLVDNSLPAQTLDKGELTSEVTKLKRELTQQQLAVNEVEKENIKIAQHNSKVDVIKEQLDKMKEKLHEENVKLTEKENLSYVIELLKKTFSTNGLVSYKIESSVKELEKRINKYLADLTYFQIYFKLVGEKLNIEVLDDIGNITSISNLSSGERARVNLATLLGIRSILSSLTNTKINLLFLDDFS